jgi:hypothetical protein
LCCLWAAGPAEPLLVWCGNGHACKEVMQEWMPMGFPRHVGTAPFVIHQTVTVTFEGEPQPWVQELLATLGETLAVHGGAAAARKSG